MSELDPTSLAPGAMREARVALIGAAEAALDVVELDDDDCLIIKQAQEIEWNVEHHLGLESELAKAIQEWRVARSETDCAEEREVALRDQALAALAEFLDFFDYQGERARRAMWRQYKELVDELCGIREAEDRLRTAKLHGVSDAIEAAKASLLAALQRTEAHVGLSDSEARLLAALQRTMR